jgi:hypothetical protein
MYGLRGPTLYITVQIAPNIITPCVRGTNVRNTTKKGDNSIFVL